MLFNSLDFAVFFLAVYGLYLLLPHRGQNVLLLLGSYAFYAWWDYRFLLLIATSTLVDYTVALCIHRTEHEKSRLRLLLVSLVVNLSILGVFKYLNFFVESAGALLGMLGLHTETWHLQILLPVGISFYTFKTLSYTLDVYGRQLEPTRNLVNYAAFVAFFPQLLSGPIDRAAALLPQLAQRRLIQWRHIQEGLWLFLWGLFKKAVVADNLATVVAPAFAASGSTDTPYAWVALYAYAAQIYCDFSGYTDMARGIARLMGFDTAINFRNPYFATNPVDFWQRWHISLSQWIQDYVYFPMAAHFIRKSSSAFYQHLPHVLTMVLIGLWHGASMTFIAFGLYWGLAIVVFNLYRGWVKARAKRLGRRPPVAAVAPLFSLRRMLAMIFFFHVVCFAFVFFRAPTMDSAMNYIATLLSWSDGVWLFSHATINVWNGLVAATLLFLPVFVIQVLQEKTGDLMAPLRLSIVPRVALYATVLTALIVFGHTGGAAFIYISF